MYRSTSSWWKYVFAPRRRRPIRRLYLERLEDRTLLSGAHDTLVTAIAPKVLAGTVHVSDFLATPNQVDLFKIQLNAQDRLDIHLSAQPSGNTLRSVLRVFDSSGAQQALDDQEGGDAHLTFQTAKGGLFFVGVSAAGDDQYLPTVANSGHGGTSTGLFTLDLRQTAAPANLADLAGSIFRLAPGTGPLAWNDPISLSLTIENRGGLAAGAFDIEVLVSKTNAFGVPSTDLMPTVLNPNPIPVPAGLAPGQTFSATLNLTLPDPVTAQAAGLPASGLVFVGLRIDPTGAVRELNKSDQSGVHRGEDWEPLTIVTPDTSNGTNVNTFSAQVLNDVNSRITGTLLIPGQTDFYQLNLGDGRLTAKVVPATGSTVVPQLTLLAPDGNTILVQSDDGTIVQNLTASSYFLEVTGLASSVGAYELTTEFVAGSAAPTVPTGRGPISIVSADVNGDGIPDLVVANSTDKSVSVLLGNGDGSFQSQQTFALPAYPTSVAVADVTGDGRPDLIVTYSPVVFPPFTVPGGVEVLQGNGDGMFTDIGGVPLGLFPTSVVVSDVNNDGNPDLIVANAGEADVSVLLGNGKGQFAAPQTFASGAHSSSVAVADVNGDGMPDLVVGHRYAAYASVLLNTTPAGAATATFAAQKTLATGPDARSVAVADVNGDGRADIIAANYDYDGFGSISVLINNITVPGATTPDFAMQQTFSTGFEPMALTMADVNGDGKLDVVISNQFPNTVSVLDGNGDGTFEAPTALSAGPESFSVAVADFNGDGHADLAAANLDANTVTVLIANTDGSFQTNPDFTTQARPFSIAHEDFNGDGKQDVVTANFDSNTISVLLGNGDGTLQNQRVIAVGKSPAAVTATDLNNDGKKDIVVANFNSNTIGVLLGNGDGSFQPQQTYAVGDKPAFVAVQDVNGDGIPDLIVANQGNDYTPGTTVSVLLGNGDGTFRTQHTFASSVTPAGPGSTIGVAPVSIAVAKLNNDRNFDLVVANQFNFTAAGHILGPGSSISVLRGNGDGTFGAPQTFAVGPKPTAVIAADLSAGNGHPDLIVTNDGDGTVSVLMDDGKGSFTSQSTITANGGGPGAYSVVKSDINGDGIPDLVVSDGGTGSVGVLLGVGNGTFQPVTIFEAGLQPTGVVVTDLNGDGKPDIVTSDNAGNRVNVLLNDASPIPLLFNANSFVPFNAASGNGLSNTPLLANLDGDTFPDAVILDRSGNILFRKGLSATGDQFASPVIINSGHPARDIVLVRTPSGIKVAAADAMPDPAFPGGLIFDISLYAVAANDTAARTVAFVAPLTTRLAAGELTGSRLDDLVVASPLANIVEIAFQKPDGTFTFGPFADTGIAPSDVAIAKVAGSTQNDIVITDEASGDVTVLLNDQFHTFGQIERFRAGTGLFDLGNIDQNDLAFPSSLAQPVSLVAGSFTGTGRNDVVVVDRGTHSFSVLTNDGNGGFHDPTMDLTTSTSDGALINSQPGPVVAGDFNGDSKLDLAILMEDTAQVWIFTGDGNGHFKHTDTIAAGTLPTGLTLIPGSRSGLSDLLVGNPFGDILRLVGNGNGTFTPPRTFTGDAAPLDVVDLTGNKQPVILSGNQAANHVSVQTLAADGSAVIPVRALTSADQLAPGALKLARLEGPAGPVDAVVLASGANAVLVYHGAGLDASGNPIFFATPTTFSVGTAPDGVTIADLNGDPIPDMIVADKGSNDVSILLGAMVGGRWSATPGPRLSLGGSIGPVSTVLRDVNGDGKPDLVVTNSDGTIRVLPGRGQGFFDDRSPMRIAVPGGDGMGAPSIVGSSGVAAAGNGNIVGIDLLGLTARIIFQGGAGEDVNAVQLLADGEVIAAFSDGTVAELLADASGQLSIAQMFAPLSGDVTDPSALATFDTEAGIRVFVTNTNSDLVVVFAPVTNPSPPIVNPSPESPFTLILTILSGHSPAENLANKAPADADANANRSESGGTDIATAPGSGGGDEDDTDADPKKKTDDADMKKMPDDADGMKKPPEKEMEDETQQTPRTVEPRAADKLAALDELFRSDPLTKLRSLFSAEIEDDQPPISDRVWNKLGTDDSRDLQRTAGSAEPDTATNEAPIAPSAEISETVMKLGSPEYIAATAGPTTTAEEQLPFCLQSGWDLEQSVMATLAVVGLLGAPISIPQCRQPVQLRSILVRQTSS
jgi:hypothetical protein